MKADGREPIASDEERGASRSTPKTHTRTHTHTESHGLLSRLYIQDILSQAREFAVLQCSDQPAQLGRSAFRLDEAVEQLIGLLIQPFSLVLVGQVVNGWTLQGPAASPQGPSYILPLTAHSVGKALNICRRQYSVL